MKRINIFFVCAVLVPIAIGMAGCKKVLEIKETDFIGGDIALQTVANNEQAIIGAYGTMNPDMAIYMNAELSDEVRPGEFYVSPTTHEWQFTTTDINIRDNYTAVTPWYRVIDRVNRVLKALPDADSMRLGDNVLRLRLRGEALFLRAYAHFELARFYSGNFDPNGLAMPYMDEPAFQEDKIIFEKARDKMGPYFEKIKADLVEAKTLIPATLADVARANAVAATGLQARIALYMKDWANAITFSTEFINALPLAPRADFTGIWTDANNLEIAFEHRRSASIGAKIGAIFKNASASATNIGTVLWAPSDKLWNSYDATNDIRFSAYLKNEVLLSNVGRQSKIVRKYTGGAYATPTENVADVKLLRTGEMYLIRAEAKAENNDLAGATADINALRTARITAYVPIATYATKDAAITDIIQERFKELAFEGHRLWDLRRKGMAVQRLTSDAPNAASVTLPAGNFRFVLPIPDAEMKANPLMEQNPGYN